MIDNNLYNLMLQITQEQKAIWRMKKYYISDAIGCEQCGKFWEKLQLDKEKQIEEMKELIKHHIA